MRTLSQTTEDQRTRLSVVVRGVVQGVGFRPFVHGLACRLELTGFVKNRNDDLAIEIEGRPAQLSSFLEVLRSCPPVPARIEEVCCAPLATTGEVGFRIEASERAEESAASFFAPDSATCRDCLVELLDPNNRRHRYPFICCAFCGPRLTVITAAPYDRDRTTMVRFPLCADCRAEYEDPRDRRFHAQSTACPVCGPRLELVDRQGEPLAGEPLAVAAGLIRQGGIVAIKGLGGYHLACDATDQGAVTGLRRRKYREEKPFALMVGDLQAADRLCQVSPEHRDLLVSAARPIVLMQRRVPAELAASVAPQSARLGLMLPYTPLHHLLLRALEGRPLVLTSGNRSDEPIAYQDADALARLGAIADAFLRHDRPIHLRCDDSVAMVSDSRPVLLRRARGYAPEPLRLPLELPRPVLAVGGHLKNSFVLGRGRHAFVSHHLGDLGDHQTYVAFRQAIEHYQALFAFTPELLVHDLHPEYASTLYAGERAGGGLATLAVQHHHAHVASCMAENGLGEPVIGVAFDGTGFGSDGSLWGGEFLVADYRSFRRAAHFRAVPLPGGEAGIRQPWRMALSHLLDAGEDPARLSIPEIDPTAVRVLERMVRQRVRSPLTSSVGRLFDAVASLLGLRNQVRFEGQAAMQLEWVAGSPDDDRGDGFPFDLVDEDTLVVDTRPLIRAVVAAHAQGRSTADVAGRFHLTLAEVIESVCRKLRLATGIETVVLSGGVFMNARLLRQTRRRLERAGFRLFSHSRVPCNDGGLGLGQLAVAAAALQGAG
jgi:hydrogenase maturation protein HypF